MCIRFDRVLNTIYQEAIATEDVVDIAIDTDDELCLFRLGVLFSLGKIIHIINENEIVQKIRMENYHGKYKSYYMSSFFWAKNRKVFTLKSSPIKRNIFLICPVANATMTQKKTISIIVDKFAHQGYNIYYPARDTNQSPYEDNIYTGGYNINCKNAAAIGKSYKILIFYDRKSRGLFFDLGVLYSHMQHSPCVDVAVLNSEDINPLLYSDKILLGVIS